MLQFSIKQQNITVANDKQINSYKVIPTITSVNIGARKSFCIISQSQSPSLLKLKITSSSSKKVRIKLNSFQLWQQLNIKSFNHFYTCCSSVD